MIRKKTLPAALVACFVGAALPSPSRAALPTVLTGQATDIGPIHARLGFSVTNQGGSPVTECGVCWGPSETSLVVAREPTAWRQRCMRQIPCLGAAYFTNDGYMDQREYAAGETYRYQAYAINAEGIGYGQVSTFTVPWIDTAKCGDSSAPFIFSMALDSPTLPIGSSTVVSRVLVCSPSPTVLNGAVIAHYVVQGAVRDAPAGADGVSCWSPIQTGLLRAGMCPAFVSVSAQAPGLVPGPATLVTKLWAGSQVLSTYETPITLQ